MLIFSIIIPVYNRPEEIRELLGSLCNQTYKNFEVIVVEDGSERCCKIEIESFYHRLNLRYFCKENSGPGLTRNYGAEQAKGNYFIFFDSDCLIPHDYMELLKKSLNSTLLDAHGGPDASHPSFTPIQRAINYAMTSFLTTGGIRGSKKHFAEFHPRSFNMGFSKKVFQNTGGFSRMRFGEDLDLSMRIKEAGFKVGLIHEAYVYHKRRTDFKKFFRQVHNSGIARINLNKRHPGTMRIIHALPGLFTLFFLTSILAGPITNLLSLVPVLVYAFSLFIDSLFKEKSVKVSLLAITASFVQLLGYGTGFIKAFWKRIVLGKGEFHAYEKNFYE